MTLYQELQPNQAGSKSYIASFDNPKDKLKHFGIYCHNVIMFNHSTLVLAYLLLQEYDVSGAAYGRRLAGLSLGASVTAAVFYHFQCNAVCRSFKCS